MLQDIWNNNYLFRGLFVIIEGNFTQILLIVYQNIRATIIKICI